MVITVKNDEKFEFESAMTAGEIVKSISEGLFRATVAVKIDGELCDLSTVVDKDCALSAITLKDKEGLDIYRHTTSHVLAQAIKNVYPTSKLAIGPTIENGLMAYYGSKVNFVKKR